ncbi:RidA family protein [Paenibacillus sp. M1]|uniref:RidA family protein n=1 Tax=Paenibacillus haidiansis TaxID=1574488 RepID=A0ABU7VMW7_9BACL
MVERVTTPFSYSSAVVAGDYIFLGLHRGEGATFAEQIRDAIVYLDNTLRKCGASLDRIVKISVYLKHIADLPEMEKIFFDYFAKDHFPARMTTTTEFIDEDCLVMIDGIAYTPAASPSHT